MKYIVLSVPDDQVAQVLADADNTYVNTQVIGVFYNFRSACNCPQKQRHNLKNWVNTTAGIKVCVKCRRVSRAHIDMMPRLIMALGKPIES